MRFLAMIDKFRGALLGLAIGDALGAPVEFKKRGSFRPVKDMQSGGVFNLPAGYWTDDTSMALCLATSLIECQGFDAYDQMLRYCEWKDEGYLSSTGKCFDIGIATSLALSHFKKTGNPFNSSTDPKKAGNGCLMRLAPVALYFYTDLNLTKKMAIDSARTTHAAPECLEASQLFSAMLHLALNGASKFDVVLQHGCTQLNSAGLQAIANGDYFIKTENQIIGSGYVVESLEAALWCFYTSDNFEEAVLKAVNLGDDADTTAAICGQLAGAFYGESAIPAHWLNALHQRKMIADLAEKLTRFKA